MSFFGFMCAPVSIPPTFDTTPCLDHLLEYEDCVIDSGVKPLVFFMPTWPTLYPEYLDGKSRMETGNPNMYYRPDERMDP